MFKNFKLGIGPMSVDLIDCVSNYAKKNKKYIFLIATRNQIDAKKFGGGYVNNFCTEKYSNYISNLRNKYLVLCRDHCGPHIKDKEKKISFKKTFENCLESLETDIKFGFKILHIDASSCRNKYEIAKKLIDHCLNYARELNKKIYFEFGTEDHGFKSSVEQFKLDLKFCKNYKEIKFLVANTGSLVKETFQVGEFQHINAKKFAHLSKKYNIFVKEHNADYLDKNDIILRKNCGIMSINIAPELAYIQNKLLYDLSVNSKGEKYFNLFYNKVISGDKWRKWQYGKISDLTKFLCSAHYYYSTKEYRKLMDYINKNLNFRNNLNYRVSKILDKFYVND